MIRQPARRFRLAIFGTSILLALFVGCGGDATSKVPDAEKLIAAKLADEHAAAAKIEAEWGVKMLAMRRTAAGYMLDFRYRVLDAEKAAPLLDRRITPYVEVVDSGLRLLVPQAPKLGSMRQTSFAVKPDRDYFIIFANPAQVVGAGEQVRVIIGKFESPPMIVQ